MKLTLLTSCFIAICTAFDTQTELLKLHNEVRLLHKVPALKTSATLVEIAKACALHNSQRDRIAHDCPKSKGFGENLAWSMSSNGSPSEADATKLAHNGWYGERKNYNYKTGLASSPGAVIGHFTQQVWKTSTQLGCASAQNKEKKSTTVVCVYNPPGNYLGLFTGNVLRRADE